ncbi:hypothetical protein OROMI_006869 [Orobanche minor]
MVFSRPENPTQPQDENTRNSDMDPATNDNSASAAEVNLSKNSDMDPATNDNSASAADVNLSKNSVLDRASGCNGKTNALVEKQLLPLQLFTRLIFAEDDTIPQIGWIPLSAFSFSKEYLDDMCY